MGLKLISGFEPTRIITKEKGLDELVDILETSKHYELYREDLIKVKEHGISLLRVAVPWHRIESIKGTYDWKWMDGYMSTLQELHIEPIMDPLHHVSIPSWLELGFLDEEFRCSYHKFFMELMLRYPWVKKYTIVNEPLVTTYFATKAAVWYPWHNSDESFAKGLRNIAGVIRYLSWELKRHNKEHWYVDSAEHHKGLDLPGKEFATMKNEYRFKLIDLLLGYVNPQHRFYKFFRLAYSIEELDSIQRSPAHIDILGLDYYSHCEFEWESNLDGGMERKENQFPIGFCEIAKQYYKRYKLPLALTETNIRGFDTDRQTWFKYMYEQCLELAKTVPVEGFCWYPFIDCTDWDSLVTQCNRNIDPQGILILNENFNRTKSEFSETIKRLASGDITVNQIKEYPYKPPLDERLIGFIQKRK